MPTARPRHTLTESDELAAALDAASRRWPEETGGRTRLLLRLVAEGHRAISEDSEAESTERREAVRRTAGALTGAYPDGYLEQLRDEWPR